ncbi:MAG: GTPase HflX [Phycisphaerales bacterium]
MPAPTERTTIAVAAERVVLAALRLPGSRHDRNDPFGELRSLAEQAGAVAVGTLEQFRERPESGTYIGSGKVEELKNLCEALDASAVIFDHELSPAQIANIEKVTGRKILDRSELILDIFASRATTHEAKLQVELAQLEYTYPRLRAMWTHLERIVGGGGVTGIGTRGPGEQQLEIDRRLVQRRELDLKRELGAIQARKRREVQKRRLDHFTVGLVGYTNAGKSTLFNTLTTGGAYADDRLFATLMTRTREWDLHGGMRVMLSDTVGFVRDLPHNLVASFKATLEEATHADLLLVVLDVADPAAEMHYEVVTRTLDELCEQTRAAEERAGIAWREPERLVLLNKADRLADNAALLVWQQRVPGSVPLCAIAPAAGGSGLGLEEVRQRVAGATRGPIRHVRLTVPMSDAKTVSTIENRGEVLDRQYTDAAVVFECRVGMRQIDRLRAAGARMRIETLDDGPRIRDAGSEAGWGR